jgi:hypothetical protein
MWVSAHNAHEELAALDHADPRVFEFILTFLY